MEFIVRVILSVLWAIFAPLGWIPYLSRIVGIFISSVFYHTLLGRQIDGVEMRKRLDASASFYQYGFVTLWNPPPQNSGRASTKNPFPWADIIWAIVFWASFFVVPMVWKQIKADIDSRTGYDTRGSNNGYHTNDSSEPPTPERKDDSKGKTKMKKPPTESLNKPELTKVREKSIVNVAPKNRWTEDQLAYLRTCGSLREGRFFVNGNTIERTTSSQTWTDNKGNSKRFKVEWINDCRYKIIPDVPTTYDKTTEIQITSVDEFGYTCFSVTNGVESHLSVARL